MAAGEIRGVCPDYLHGVRQAFENNFSQGLELGARFALAIEGDVVVDLIGGWADRARSQPFAEDTLTSVFSTTKAIASVVIARLVDSGRLDYEERVADVWPEFAAAGKGEITVGQALSHQAALPGFAESMDSAAWFDWDFIATKLATMAPLWPPGTASGYHPVTFGYLAGEIFRRIDGRTIGVALREDLAEPLGLDLWIGLPDAEHARCAAMQKPPAAPNLGPTTEPKRVAFMTKWASPGHVSLAEWRRADIPSVTGHATAPALARLMAIFACDGMLDGRRLLASASVREAARERVRGADLVLPNEMSWAAGFIRNHGLWIYGPGRESFGHSGWGGSCAFADPERGLSGAYVMNRQSAELIADARAMRLIEAVYEGI
jgi:CubicO group peptidase (beta-lactamase class C family)